jgi:uncharacterized membrane protein
VTEVDSPRRENPYTAVQAIDRLTVLFYALATHPLGYHVATDPTGAAVTVPGRTFGDYLATMCGLIRRYGAGEPTVITTLLRLLGTCATVEGPESHRLAAIDEQTQIVLDDAEREIRRPADLAAVQAEAAAVRAAIHQRAGSDRSSAG